MKNKLLSSTAALIVLAGSSALAADLPVYAEPVAPAPMSVAAPLWTGFYVGAAAGFAFDDNDGFDCDVAGCFAEYGFDDDDHDDDANWFVGLRAGADWQFGSFVVGALVDANWLDSGDSSSSAFDADLIGEPDGFGVDPEDQEAFIDGQTIVLGDFPGQAANATYVMEDFSGIDWYGTARLRAGIAPGGGRVLLYGTGGLAFGGGNDGGGYSAYFAPGEVEVATTGNGSNTTTSDDEIDELSSLTGLDCDRADFVRTDDGFDIDDDEGAMCSSGDGDDDVMWGFALGAGAEVLVTDHISVGVEALYVNLDGDDFDVGEVFDGGDDDGADNDFWTVGLNVNARF